MEKLSIGNNVWNRRSIYDLLFIFLVCGMLGWIFETIAVYITVGKLTDRGYLFILNKLSSYFPVLKKYPLIGNIPLIWGLPLIQIYGIGGVLMTVFFGRLKKHPIRLFFVGAFWMTLFELFSSYLTSWLLGRTYWDYSQEFMNFQGRICLKSTIMWGILSLFAVMLLGPLLDKLYQRFERVTYYKAAVIVLVVYTIICEITKYWLDPTIISN
ncbi:putative ABC transporter permease [Enterococcus sp. CWB-B31]|uniref:putative ABC transporter permease n=1 Tax=Enterococcus sp. CWB-B31 TaxID=2885159 RepID=UPI001E5A4E5C|nr:putative ABC transporter permease [Enterococcus sp. CWB-B31]MCB5953864.1 putative ABC transporter permease [Enterococcus sp. CWB-B31]